jgi:L,D-peptidoglycan transpeptidase YkuD (ErfK/YbiS/YcfS/YnhG family)
MKKTPRPPPRTGLRFVTVTRNLGGPPHQGLLIAGVATFPCALGRKGLVRVKREGDGGTPIGGWRLLGFRHRPLRLRRAGLRLPTRDVRPSDLWCDDPGSFFYNRPLRAPSRFRCERLWRGDALYDVVGVLDYNLRPAKRGRGSAIFFHIATQDLAPTEGCVALRARDMARLTPRLARGAALVIR